VSATRPRYSCGEPPLPSPAATGSRQFAQSSALVSAWEQHNTCRLLSKLRAMGVNHGCGPASVAATGTSLSSSSLASSLSSTSSSSSWRDDVSCNVVLVGDSRVGKTALLNRVVHDRFSPVSPHPPITTWLSVGCAAHAQHLRAKSTASRSTCLPVQKCGPQKLAAIRARQLECAATLRNQPSKRPPPSLLLRVRAGQIRTRHAKNALCGFPIRDALAPPTPTEKITYIMQQNQNSRLAGHNGHCDFFLGVLPLVTTETNVRVKLSGC
jgi:hypothetical protein